MDDLNSTKSMETKVGMNSGIDNCGTLFSFEYSPICQVMPVSEFITALIVSVLS